MILYENHDSAGRRGVSDSLIYPWLLLSPMRRRGFDHTHEHDFAEPDYLDADEHVRVTFRCNYAPIYGSKYSERHDEVFYDEGPRCEARRYVDYEIEGVYWGETRITYEDSESLWIAVTMAAERYLNGIDPWQSREMWGDDTTCSVDVEHEGRTYTVRYEKFRESVDEY